LQNCARQESASLKVVSPPPAQQSGALKLVSENSDSCPTCGAPARIDRLLIDLNYNSIVYQGRKWFVAPRLAEFMICLMRSHPAGIADAEMKVKIWGHDRLQHVSDLSGLAHSARMMLRPFGSEVIRDKKLKGYRLVLYTQHVKRR